MKCILFIVFVFFAGISRGQRTDFILLKKKNKTIARYYAGTQISFTANTGAYVNALIEGIKNDSLFLKEFIIKTYPTQLGVYVLDTVGTYRYQYHYKDVKVMGKSTKGFDISASAGSLMGGGLLLTLGSGIVFLADREKFSPTLLAASASLAAIGYLMAKTSGKGMILGKKYHLVYMGLSSK